MENTLIQIHGFRLHLRGQRQSHRFPVARAGLFASAAHHDSKALKEQKVALPDMMLFGDLAFADRQLVKIFNQQQSALITGRKSRKANS